MYTLDANIFIRDLDVREPEHDSCHELLERLNLTATPIILPLLALAEVAGTVSRTHRDPIRGRLAGDLLRTLPNIILMPLDDILAEETFHLAADYALRGADALYVATARRNNTILVTLDREVYTRARPIIRVLTPTEALATLS
jgi:predicted nucleic acid-binding protein